MSYMRNTVPPADAKKVGLPVRTFLYTLDQLSVMLELSVNTLQQNYVYFEGRSIGSRDNSFLTARNLAPANKPPEWRVTEKEFIRWMRSKGFRYYEVRGFMN